MGACCACNLCNLSCVFVECCQCAGRREHATPSSVLGLLRHIARQLVGGTLMLRRLADVPLRRHFTTAVAPSSTLRRFGQQRLRPWLASALRDAKFPTPRPIQAAAIDSIAKRFPLLPFEMIYSLFSCYLYSSGGTVYDRTCERDIPRRGEV